MPGVYAGCAGTSGSTMSKQELKDYEAQQAKAKAKNPYASIHYQAPKPTSPPWTPLTWVSIKASPRTRPTTATSWRTVRGILHWLNTRGRGPIGEKDVAAYRMAMACAAWSDPEGYNFEGGVHATDFFSETELDAARDNTANWTVAAVGS